MLTSPQYLDNDHGATRRAVAALQRERERERDRDIRRKEGTAALFAQLQDSRSDYYRQIIRTDESFGACGLAAATIRQHRDRAKNSRNNVEIARALWSLLRDKIIPS